MEAEITRIMQYSDSLNKVVSIVARIMAAQSRDEKDPRAALCRAPTAENRERSLKLLFIIESLKAKNEMRKKIESRKEFFSDLENDNRQKC